MAACLSAGATVQALDNLLGSAAMRRALITGICGQDGGYLARRLCELDYSVVGTTHRSDGPPTLQIGDRTVPVLRVARPAGA